MTEIEDVKNRLDIVAVVDDHVTLERVGSRYKALCPFHQETDPSFFVFPESQSWYCFGACEEGGDVFDFVQKANHWDFYTALRELARRADVELKPLSPEKKAELAAQRSYETALGRAADHFAANLRETAVALAYAQGRAWTNEMIEAEGLGYADGDPLPELGDERAQRVAASLNRWAGSVGGALIYVHRERGRVVYLNGRSIEGKHHYNPPSDLAGPRRPYLNAVYSPSASELTIVEGPACAISLGGWDVPALALIGAGLSGDLPSRLRRHVGRDATIYLVPDGDGRTDVDALAEIVGPTLGVVSLPEGIDDVNDWAQAGAVAEDIRELLDAAPTWLDLEIERVAGVQGPRATAARRDLFEILADLDAFLLESRYRERVKKALGLRQSQVNRLLKMARGDDVESQQDDERYTIQDGQLCVVRRSRKGERHVEPLCNFVAEVVEDVTFDDGFEQPERHFRIAGQLNDGTPLPIVEVEADRFSRMDWVSDGWGVRAILRAGGYRKRAQLREAIQLQSQDAEQRHIFTHTGWREIDGERVYLHGGGAVGRDDVEVELDLNLSRYVLPNQPQDLQEAVASSLRFLEVAPMTVTVPLWATVYLAPLTPILEPTFMVWLYGLTGVHKSTLAALALCHYGAFTYKTLPADWFDTSGSLELACFRAKDALLVIDDFAPQTDPYRVSEMAQRIAYVIRAMGNRSGRGRLTSTIAQRPIRPPRGMVLSTGEQLPSGWSSMARVYTVEMEADDVDLEALTRAQDEAWRYPHALTGYLQWLADRWDRLCEELPTRRRDLRATLIDAMRNDHRRIPETVATLYLGLDLGLAYTLNVGVLTEAEAEAWRAQGWAAIKTCAIDQARRVERQKPTELFFNTLADLLALGRAYLEEIGSGSRIGGQMPQIERVGWFDREYIYLLPAARNRVARFLRDEGVRFPLEKQALRKHLHEEGYLMRESDNRYTARIWDGERQHRVLKLRRKAVAQHVDLLLDDASEEGGR